MRQMFDSAAAAAVPPGSQLVAGYCDGHYRWSDADWAMFPGTVLVRIAVNPSTPDGSVLDVEPGNWTSADAVPWIVQRRAAGVEPTVYCNNGDAGYTCTEVTAACQAAGVEPPQFWLAQWDGVAELPDGYVAKQYKSGNAYDTSIVADYWPGVDPAPTPPDGSDVPDALARLALIDQAIDAGASQLHALVQGTREDLSTVANATKPPPAPPDTQSQIDGLVTSLEKLNEKISAIDADWAGTDYRVHAIEEWRASLPPLVVTPAPPVFTPPAYHPSVAAVLPVIVAILLIFVQQTLVVVRALPPSTAVTVALAVLTVLAMALPLIEQLLQQQTALALHVQAVMWQRAATYHATAKGG